MNLPVRKRAANAFGQLPQHMHRGEVYDGVHRVEAQPVEVKLLDPVQRVMNEVFANRVGSLAVHVDRAAPRCLVTVGEKLRRDCLQERRFRTEMVVDHIEQNHQAAAMRGVDQRFQVFGATIG
jgi:hypothetical protein